MAQFASFGFIVCAIEHRDGSAPRSFVNRPVGQQANGDMGEVPDAKVNERPKKMSAKDNAVKVVSETNNPSDGWS
jgi:platelet-activating factor acetylhydrolase